MKSPSAKKRIAIIFGGQSSEHQVSLLSAKSILSAIDRERYEILPVGISLNGQWRSYATIDCFDQADDPAAISLAEAGLAIALNPGNKQSPLGDLGPIDAVFPVLHGRFGEDGTIQGMLEILGLPYVGSGVAASAIAIDKDLTKRILADHQLPVVPWIALRREQPFLFDQAEQRFGLPFFVKPAMAGSSVGVTKITSADQFDTALNDAFEASAKVLIEPAINAREIEIAILGNDQPEASFAGEIRLRDRYDFYSYQAKYLDPDSADFDIPAKLSPQQAAGSKRLALDCYRAIGARGLARVDLFLDKANGRWYCNEINTLPGFTSISMYPKLWLAGGLSYAELISRLIELALADE